jgi:predicted nucleic acid-binding protein
MVALSGGAMKPKLYIETTVISYLAARRSRDLIVAGHQESTRKWWRERRGGFALFCSQLVVQEASAGDSDAVARRLRFLREVPVLVATDAIGELARRLTRSGGIPSEASEDAVHVAFAVIHGMDYLVTWNCRHIANAQIRNNLSATCYAAGYELPVICTPEELLGE